MSGAARAAGLALLASALCSGAARAVPLCRASVELDPPQATVGQQVIYRLRIERRHDVATLFWERNLSFPAFRAEWLPGSVGDAGDRSEAESYRLFEERRALFPVRAGRLEIPPAGLLCRSPDAEEAVVIPGARILVTAPPAVGRPDDYTGVVGSLRVSMSVAPERVALGESVRVSLVATGEANVWEVRSGLEERLRSADLEVFIRPRELARDAGRRLSLRRYFTYDLVPRRTGSFQIPEIRIPYLDPATGRYAVAVAQGRRFVVGEPPPVAAAQGEGRPAPAAAEAERTPQGGMERAPWIAAGVVLAALGAWLLARRKARSADCGADVDAALAQAEAAERAGRTDAAAAALARALRAGLSAGIPDAAALSNEELRARAEDDTTRALVALLERVDRERFAKVASLDELRGVLRKLRELRGRAAADAPSGGC